MTNIWLDPQAAPRVLDEAHIQDMRARVLEPPVFRSEDVWLPINPKTIVSVTGATASIAETTVPLVASLSVPPRTVAVQYRIEISATAGTGAASLELRHAPGWGWVVKTRVLGTGVVGEAAGVVDANLNRVTYAGGVGGTITYDYTIAVTGFVRSP